MLGSKIGRSGDHSNVGGFFGQVNWQRILTNRFSVMMIAGVVVLACGVGVMPIQAAAFLVVGGVTLVALTDMEKGLYFILLLAVLSPVLRVSFLPGLRPDELLALIMVLTVLLRRKIKGKSRIAPMFFWIFGADVASRVISTLVGAATVGSEISVTDFYWMFKPIQFYLLLLISYQVGVRGLKPEVILQNVAIGGILASLVGMASFGNFGGINTVLYQFGYFDTSNAERYFGGSGLRAMSTFGYATTFAVYLALVIVLSVAALLSSTRRNKKQRVLFGVAVGLSALALLMTGSRTGLIVVFIGLMVEAVLSRQTRYIVFMGGLALIVALLSPFFFGARYVELYQAAASGDPFASSSLGAKVIQWSYVYDLLKSNLLIGIGRGKLLYASWFDNYYLETVFQRGLIGLTIFFWMHGSVLIYAKRLLQKGQAIRGMSYALALSLICITIVLLIANISGSFTVDRIGSVYWILVGLMLSQAPAGMTQSVGDKTMMIKGNKR